MRHSAVPRTIGEELVHYRLKHHLKQRDIAEVLGVHVTTVRNWERGRASPCGEVVERIRSLIATVR
jgi:DNA-binding transcriptional regulator YiaG